MKSKVFAWSGIACLCAAILLSGCRRNVPVFGRAYFEIDSQLNIVVPVGLSDSLTARLVFDSPIQGVLVLDSSFCAAHPSGAWGASPNWVHSGRNSAWSHNRLTVCSYEIPLEMNIGGVRAAYDRFRVQDWRRSIPADGLFGIPSDDTAHVWELNFDHHYLEVHRSDSFTLPKDCFLFPFVEGRRPGFLFVRMPLSVRCADGDTLTLDREFLIDTGMGWDVAILHPAAELDFFEKKEAVWNPFGDGYSRRYTVEAEMPGGFAADSLRIYTLDDPADGLVPYLIGLNFLKRFNVFFDMRGRRLGLQPVRNFRRTDSHSHRFHLSIRQDSAGRFVIAKIGDYAANRYKTAGLKEGDEVVAVNGKRYDPSHGPYGLSEEDAGAILRQSVKVFDIVRDGKPLRITVEEDPGEMRGD